VASRNGPAQNFPDRLIEGIVPPSNGRVFRSTVWQSGKTEFINPANKKVPFFRRWMAHPMANTAQCEFTIHETVAATIFTYAMLMDEGWTPSAELKNRHPRRDDQLFGYWYMP
jgi:hypothetical protein